MTLKSGHRCRKSANLAAASLLLLLASATRIAGADDDASPPAVAPAPALVRITSSFEVKHAAAVLRQVAKLFHAGFVRKDAEQVARDIEALPADQSRRWEFAVTYKRVNYPLQIRARLDDFGMLDLDFFCAPAAAEAVRNKVDGYLNSRGL
jgi:hypothetical protein